MQEIQEVRKSGKTPAQPATIGVQKSYADIYVKEFAEETSIKILFTEKFPFEYKMNERPDMYGVATDSAWTENLSLLGHNFETEIFHLPGLNPDDWMNKYLETPAKEDRIRMLNKLHFDLLKNAAIIPYAAYPYYAVATKDWSLNFSAMNSTTDLWRMRKN